MEFWDRLQKKLYEKKATAAELSRAVGVSQASINGWKNGAFPRADMACKVAKALDTTVEYLVNGDEPYNVPQDVLDLAYEVYALPELFRNIVFDTVKNLSQSVSEQGKEEQQGFA